MSWFSGPGGFELFVNRDELRSRPLARPPAPAERDGVRYLAPEDTAAGGTWVTVNELGLALSLLNREWPDDTERGELRDPTRFTSRGALVRALSGAGSAEAAMARLAGRDLAPHQPFTLLTLAPDEGPRLAWWDGRALTVSPAPPEPPLASSSPQPDALAVRRALWRETTATLGGDGVGVDPGRRRAAALAFHRSHRPARGASSPCMHRPEARTVSLCHVRVDDDRVSMAYAAGPPCRHRLGAPSTLDRRGVRATV